MSVIENYCQLDKLLRKLCETHNCHPLPLILPVSKRKPASDIRQLYDSGVRDFAENYLQEAQQKNDELSDFADIRWHYIGKIQSKKCKHLAKQMSWVHTIDDVKQAMLLDQYCLHENREKLLNVCIQVNVHQEEQKNGIAPSDVPSFAQQLVAFPNLCLRGLMLIGKFGLSVEQQVEAFTQMKKLFTMCKKRLNAITGNEHVVDSFDTLSMGMSGDWQTAVENGSTIIRIGTTIFGERK